MTRSKGPSPTPRFLSATTDNLRSSPLWHCISSGAPFPLLFNRMTMVQRLDSSSIIRMGPCRSH